MMPLLFTIGGIVEIVMTSPVLIWMKAVAPFSDPECMAMLEAMPGEADVVRLKTVVPEVPMAETGLAVPVR